MPLKEGYSPQSISENIKREIAAGADKKQAIAIAMSKAREAREKLNKKGK